MARKVHVWNEAGRECFRWVYDSTDVGQALTDCADYLRAWPPFRWGTSVLVRPTGLSAQCVVTGSRELTPLADQPVES